MSVPQAALKWYDNGTSFYNIDVSPRKDFSGVLQSGLLAQNLWWNITTTNTGILRSITIYAKPEIYKGTGNQLGTLTVSIAVSTALGVFSTVNQATPIPILDTLTNGAANAITVPFVDSNNNYTLRIDAPQTYRITASYTSNSSGAGNVAIMCGDYGGDQTYNSNAATALTGLPQGVQTPYPACQIKLAADGGWTGYNSTVMMVPPMSQLSDAAKEYWGFNTEHPDPDNTIANLDARFCTAPVPSIGANNCTGWVNPIHFAPGNQWNPIDYPTLSALITADTLNNNPVIPGPTRSIWGVQGVTAGTAPWGETYPDYTVMTTCDKLENPAYCSPNSGTYSSYPLVFMDLERPAVDAGWSDWGPWDDCHADCGSDGLQYSTRQCNNPAPTLNAKGCQGDYIKSQSCTAAPCMEVVCPVPDPVSYTYVNTPHTTVYQSDGTVIETGAVTTTSNAAAVQVQEKNNYTVYLLVLIFIILIAMTISYAIVDDQPYTIVE